MQTIVLKQIIGSFAALGMKRNPVWVEKLVCCWSADRRVLGVEFSKKDAGSVLVALAVFCSVQKENFRVCREFDAH